MYDVRVCISHDDYKILFVFLVFFSIVTRSQRIKLIMKTVTKLASRKNELLILYVEKVLLNGKRKGPLSVCLHNTYKRE